MSEKPDRAQKTEPPTPKRKKDARRKGQVSRSAEVVAWSTLLVATWLIPYTYRALADGLVADVGRITDTIADPQAERLVPALVAAIVGATWAVAPFVAAMVVLGVLGNVAQVGLLLSGTPLKPKSERINPLKGLKRIFSIQGAWQGAKALLKVLAIAVVAVPAVMAVAEHLAGGGVASVADTVTWVGQELLGIVRLIAIIGLVVAAADYAFQRHRHHQDLKMTQREVRDELKNSEGDPHLKQRIRTVQRSMSRNRMLSGVADANVVIVNPTHLAVALAYTSGQGPPRVVAKGADNMADRIRKLALEHGVPIVEAKPVARALFEACQVDDEIPFALFGVVARVLAFVQQVAARAPLGGRYVLPGV